MSISDMIKKSVLEKFTAGDLTTISIIVTLAMAGALGLFVYAVYRLTAKSGFYDRGLNKSLAVLPLITAGILMAMQSNLVISLGMVGALSIVRFRNAVKAPMDLLYLFWSISLGIVVGAGLFELAVLLALCTALLMALLDMLPTLRAPCLLVLRAGPAADEAALTACMKQHAPKARLRSRSRSTDAAEWIWELRAKDEAALVQALAALPEVLSVNLLSHDGDMRI